MRILHIISGLGTGGAEAMLLKLVRGASRHEHAVASLSGSGDLGADFEAAGVQVVTTRLRSLSGLLGAPAWLRRLTDRVRPDIVQGWLPHGNFAATLAAASARGGKLPLAWNVRQSLADFTHEKPLTRGLIFFNARLSRRPRAIVYNSLSGALDHEAIGYAPERRHFIPNGFDLDSFAPSRTDREMKRRELGIAAEEVAIGLVARFHSMKNHGAFLEAASCVLDEFPRVRFVLAGSGVTEDNAALMGLIADPRVRRASVFLGNRRDMEQVTRAFDIACNVSLHGEGFPNAIGEAMACGVPCVVTDVGDSATIVADAGVTCGDVSGPAIAAALLGQLRAGRQERCRLGGLARKRIEDHFSLAAVVGQYDGLYDSFAAGGVRIPEEAETR